MQRMARILITLMSILGWGFSVYIGFIHGWGYGLLAGLCVVPCATIATFILLLLYWVAAPHLPYSLQFPAYETWRELVNKEIDRHPSVLIDHAAWYLDNVADDVFLKHGLRRVQDEFQVWLEQYPENSYLLEGKTQ